MLAASVGEQRAMKLAGVVMLAIHRQGDGKRGSGG